ncbi:uncharacterized protein LOC130441317 [Diorhabda sublineata]|uniref:uncharacterized protein LOC130441317 n=1 Tax=Diorhabda sublineata TaxID=1163346 RepID=UPI0024E0AB7F|nr:uncharacterized protein LOC130441317 [Diorhabda sublineata]
MAISVILMAVCCLFVVTCAWDDYTDYYDYEDVTVMEVTIGSKKDLHCFPFDSIIIQYWKHNGQEYHEGENLTYLHWIDGEPGAIEVTFLSQEQAGRWECYYYGDVFVSYYFVIVPDKGKQQLWPIENMEESRTNNTYIETTETYIPRETTEGTVEVVNSTLSIRSGEIENEDIQSETYDNFLDVLLNSLRNPFVRADQIKGKSGAITLNASYIALSIFIVNLLTL